MENLEKIFQEQIKDLGIEIYDVEYVTDGGYNYLRVYIESNDLDDCEKVSTAITEEADKYIKEKFFLEVSTPGIERKLKKEKDFIRFKGKKIEVRTKSNVDNKKVFVGILNGFENNNILLDEYVIPISKLKNAKILYDFNENNEMGGIK